MSLKKALTRTKKVLNSDNQYLKQHNESLQRERNKRRILTQTLQQKSQGKTAKQQARLLDTYLKNLEKSHKQELAKRKVQRKTYIEKVGKTKALSLKNLKKLVEQQATKPNTKTSTERQVIIDYIGRGKTRTPRYTYSLFSGVPFYMDALLDIIDNEIVETIAYHREHYPDSFKHIESPAKNGLTDMLKGYFTFEIKGFENSKAVTDHFSTELINLLDVELREQRLAKLLEESTNVYQINTINHLEILLRVF